MIGVKIMTKNNSSENNGDHLRECVSFFSQLYHFVSFGLKKSDMNLERGMFIVSIDVDVGSRQLGVINNGENDLNVHNELSEYNIGTAEEVSLPIFLEMFNKFEIPVTFAMRGQMTEVNDSPFELLVNSSVKHDIGAHGYSHKAFTALTPAEAENELTLISKGMKKFGVTPRSFIFPRNQVSHLDLLVKHGYKCYRTIGGFKNDRMFIERQNQIYNIYPSLYLDQSWNFSIAKKIVNLSIRKRTPFHVWFHLWNFGTTLKTIQRNLKPLSSLFEYAAKKQKSGDLSIETMLSAVENLETQQG